MLLQQRDKTPLMMQESVSAVRVFHNKVAGYFNQRGGARQLQSVIVLKME